MKKVFTLALTGLFVLIAVPAFAQQEAADPQTGLIALAAGLAMGIAALGGSLGQGRATASAVEAIGRNPGASGKITVPMIIGLALIESLVIYSFVVALILAP
jgi:F-type H+-transporting ATPase subunit c